ncbi:MAG TPA: hypothetical protein VFL81_03090 [Candidatus Saccharimonadales bacterium]|nr:hypothetical protein [Candidatus Saccharimonadales bacterium]
MSNPQERPSWLDFQARQREEAETDEQSTPLEEPAVYIPDWGGAN